MNFWTHKTAWSNLEFIPLKLAIGSAYILIGALFHDFILQYHVFFAAIFLVTVIWSIYKWVSKMKQKNYKE